MARLQDEVSIVTGSTSGLGEEIARRFTAEGAATVVTGRNRSKGEAIAADIRASGGRCQFIAADLSSEDDRVALVETTRGLFGHVTVLVNNAVSPEAISDDGPVADTTVETWDRMLGVNLIAVASMCRHTIPQMLEIGHGSIVNISSRAAQQGTSGLAAYTASKGGLTALSRSITVDYARRGVRCNTVQPGYILHQTRDHNATEEHLSRVAGMHLTRLTTARDVALAALYLASSESEVVSGVTLPIDGGSSAVRGLTLG